MLTMIEIIDLFVPQVMLYYTSLFTQGNVSVLLPFPRPDPEPVGEPDSLVLPKLLLDASESLLDSVTAPR